MLVYRLKNSGDVREKKIYVRDLKTHEAVETVIVKDVTKLDDIIAKLPINKDRFYVDSGEVRP